MSRIGWRISWLVIVASLAFMAGYLLRYGNPATGQSASPSQQPAVAPPGGTLAPGPAAPDQAAPSPPVTAISPSAVKAKPAVSQSKGLAPALPVAEPSSQPAGGAETAPPQPTPQPPSGSAPAPPPQTPPPADAPRITFPETVYDFGVMWQDQEVTHEYAFTNTGKSALKINTVTSSCGCTAALPSKKEFSPGESGTIKATFHSGRYRDRVTKHITVDSADPVQPRVVLTLTGIVKAELDVLPSSLYIGSLRIGESTERLVTLSPVEVKKFTILEVKADSPLLQVSAPEPGPAGKEGSYQLKIKFGPADKVGRVNTNVIVRTNLPHTKEVTIAVFGRIVEKEPPSAQPPATP
jgi:hypothetical protein